MRGSSDGTMESSSGVVVKAGGDATRLTVDGFMKMVKCGESVTHVLSKYRMIGMIFRMDLAFEWVNESNMMCDVILAVP